MHIHVTENLIKVLSFLVYLNLTTFPQLDDVAPQRGGTCAYACVLDSTVLSRKENAITILVALKIVQIE